MKRKEIPNRSRRVTIRLQMSEYEQLSVKFKASTCRKLSEYARHILLNKPIHVRYRNQSADEFLSVALQLKKELGAIGNNYNQAMKKLHLLRPDQDLHEWMAAQQNIQKMLLEKVNEINLQMDKIYQLWLQK
jgi:hypothetical protein